MANEVLEASHWREIRRCERKIHSADELRCQFSTWAARVQLLSPTRKRKQTEAKYEQSRPNHTY